MHVQADVPGERLERPGARAPLQDVPDPRRGEGVACRGAGSAAGGHDARGRVGNPSRSCRGLARWRSTRLDPQPKRPPLQAVGSQGLRGRASQPGPAGARLHPHLGDNPDRRPGARRPLVRGGSRREHGSQHPHAATRDLPPSARPRRNRCQSDDRARAARRRGQPRQDRLACGGRGAARRAARARPCAVGNRHVRGPSTRRAARPSAGKTSTSAPA